MSLLTTYCHNGLCLVAIARGMKGPITAGWNLRENRIMPPDPSEIIKKLEALE
jgi:hypothetical protein